MESPLEAMIELFLVSALAIDRVKNQPRASGVSLFKRVTHNPAKINKQITLFLR